MSGVETNETQGRRLEPFLVPFDASAEAVRAIIEPMIDSWGMELVQLHYVHGAHKSTVRVFVDKKNGGIGIDEIEKLSRLIGDTLDVEDANGTLFKGQWELEVSSPGVDRPLTKKSHFQKAQGELVKVKTRGPVDGARSISGTLGASDDAGFVVRKDGGGDVKVPWREVHSAHTVYRFENAQRPAPKRKKKSQRKTDEE